MQEYKLYLVPVEEVEQDETLPDNEENLPEDDNDTENIPDDDENNTENEEVIEVKIGDVNNDGKISPTDYVLIKNHIMQIKLLQTDTEMKAADVNKDGKISPIDYVLVKNHIMYGNEI